MGVLKKIAICIVGGYCAGFGLLLLANPGNETLLEPRVLAPLIVMAFVLVFLVRILAWANDILERRR